MAPIWPQMYRSSGPRMGSEYRPIGPKSASVVPQSEVQLLSFWAPGTWNFQRSAALVMTGFNIRCYNVPPRTELHRSLWAHPGA